MELSIEQLQDAHDLRSVIGETLSRMPIDEEALRRGVWTYASAEHAKGASPGDVINELTELVDSARIAPTAVRRALARRVVLWCVESYFGQLGGEPMGYHLGGPAIMTPRLVP